MNKRNNRLYVKDILESIKRIENYISDQSYDEFIKNDMIRDAVLRNLEVIGEAAKNIPDAIREKYPDVPWKRIIGLRNIVIHEYFGVDFENIWKIIKENIPEIKPFIEKIHEKME
ncbi:MAG: DUF86 domain-containing protein [Thermoplasmata archaeon]|nr:MAG: DUF86 domain-containing protein [Thermoplasmata archaeon]